MIADGLHFTIAGLRAPFVKAGAAYKAQDAIALSGAHRATSLLIFHGLGGVVEGKRAHRAEWSRHSGFGELIRPNSPVNPVAQRS